MFVVTSKGMLNGIVRCCKMSLIGHIAVYKERLIYQSDSVTTYSLNTSIWKTYAT